MIIFLMIALFQSATLAAQEASEENSGSDPIVVTGVRLSDEKALRNAVDLVAPSDSPDEPLAKFSDPLCVAVIGLGEDAGQTVKNNIEGRAGALHIAIGKEGCDTNALVVIVDGLKPFLEQLKKKQPRLVSLAAKRSIEKALGRGDPVIAWSTEELRSSLGRELPHSSAIPGLTLPMAVSTKVNTDARPRRLDLNLSAAVVNSVVAFDVNQLVGMHLTQLSDYSAMRILAPSHVPAKWLGRKPASILRLFSTDPSDAEKEFTAFDKAYLEGLYKLPINASASRLKAAVLQSYAGQ